MRRELKKDDKIFAKSIEIRDVSQNITLLTEIRTNTSLENWTNELLSQGKFAFSLKALRNTFPNQSDAANKSALKRLSDKGNIISIHKGYYLIIPPQYKAKGILPPSLYLDAFMEELKRPYYLALLNAAANHGAAHQQPQEFYVVTNFPALRPTYKKGLKVNYFSKKELPEKLLDIKKTETGYLKISNPVLTATDLIQYSKRVGGINRVATVLSELREVIKPEAFDSYLIQNTPVTALQRLGYLLDIVFDDRVLANALYTAIQNNNVVFFRTPLRASATKGFPADEKWKVIINTAIELDE